jgi:hypothetical protein
MTSGMGLLCEPREGGINGTKQQEPPPIDTDVNIYEAVQRAFQVYDDVGVGEDPLTGEANAKGVDADNHLEEALDAGSLIADDDDNPPDPHSGAQAILEDSATTPLFVDSQLSCLTATLLLLNCLRVHGASNALINELFTLLSRSVLPTVNSLPTTEYSASKMLKQLGLTYEMIHYCVDGCMLFQGVGSDLLD